MSQKIYISCYSCLVLYLHDILEQAELWICLNSECVWCSTEHKVTVQITERLSSRGVFRTLTNISDGEICQKNNSWVQAPNQKFFRLGELDTSELGYIDKHFLKNAKRRSHMETFLRFFLLDTLKTTFWMKSLTKRWTPSGPYFQNLGTFFDFSCSCATQSTDEYASISLNISKYS